MAFTTQDQENEHSCFSDTTNADITANAEGIRAVYLAEHPRVEGTSLSEVVAEADPDLHTRLLTHLDASVALARGLDEPFDQLIMSAEDEPGWLALDDLARSLEDQGATIVELGDRLLGETISTSV